MENISKASKLSKIPCDGCKLHHIKCDRVVEGCSNCKRREIDCTYLIERRRRGPKTKVESMMKYVESMNSSANSNANSETEDSSSREVVNNVESIQISPKLSYSLCNQTNQWDSTLIYQTSSELPLVYQNYYNPLLYPNFVNFQLNTAGTNSTAMPVTADQVITMQDYSRQLSSNYCQDNAIGIQDPDHYINHVDNSQNLEQNPYKKKFN
ncbi:hypothetical protein CONCODRAFT_83604 [Conidiobolus coronatus NRRL 28638]|uniref:Zn(2)-C6 fungal-type domain-containing protein n=1 Tax=Conidiobolus coronatus (strain ATCC 28846 / CBS 209.66 / NRRL 28638) TaxID=796925 RepID=A0A137PE69_CONC2|nr:hypothetical protein CONCODRAFT_83604 [Conidiobolus coronatus NRRL 28638]|eukprot:KXN73287.1 hypothetical protein CONCODRAFT_83604 [Conidiobolus coronatus NRRL 28638]